MKVGAQVTLDFDNGENDSEIRFSFPRNRPFFGRFMAEPNFRFRGAFIYLISFFFFQTPFVSNLTFSKEFLEKNENLKF